ncbi:MAG: DUF2007 domain-containing protein [Spirochaetaceae bacterium]|nr:DUF2007 domain-containing protein [Spirochaetaceae bacterium]
MELLCLASGDDVAYIESIRALLEERGIPAMVKNAYTQNLFGGLKPFSGHDPIAGSIQLFIDEKDYDGAVAALEGSGFLPMGEDLAPGDQPAAAREEPASPPGQDDEALSAARRKRDIYFAYLLSASSFLVLPYVLNLPLLYRIGKERRTIALMLLALGSLGCGLGLFFILRSGL